MPETLTITDNRTGRSYELPIEEGAVRSTAFAQMHVDEGDRGLVCYDPAFMNTASCRSSITYVDGERGILLYRGYPIEQLAESSTFLEVAYLLIHGELPRPTRGPTTSPPTRWCTRTSRVSWGASTMTPIRWGCWCRWWVRCRPSIRRPPTSATRSSAGSPSAGSSPRCRPWRRSPTGIMSVCTTSCPTTS